MRLITTLLIVSMILCSSTALGQLPSGWKAHDLNRPAPKIVTPADKNGAAPSDAVVLFDGSDLSHWSDGRGGDPKWTIVEGAMESVPGSGYVFSKEKFGDCQLHIEFATPKTVKGEGQGRGNSGVFLMGQFEVQVLDSFENATYSDGSAGAIYGQFPPLVNASRKPGEWQSYDIVFRRPRFDESGELTKAARLTVLHNGVVIQDSSEAYGPTRWIQFLKYNKTDEQLPVSLQDHGNPIRYRNIWVRKLVESPAAPKEPYDPTTLEITDATANQWVGKYGAFPVKLENGKLFLYFHQNPLEMVPHSKTEFGFLNTAGSGEFKIDENGKAISLTFSLDAAGKQSGKREQEERP